MRLLAHALLVSATAAVPSARKTTLLPLSASPTPSTESTKTECECGWANSGSCQPEYEDGTECRRICCSAFTGSSPSAPSTSESTTASPASTQADSSLCADWCSTWECDENWCSTGAVPDDCVGCIGLVPSPAAEALACPAWCKLWTCDEDWCANGQVPDDCRACDGNAEAAQSYSSASDQSLTPSPAPKAAATAGCAAWCDKWECEEPWCEDGTAVPDDCVGCAGAADDAEVASPPAALSPDGADETLRLLLVVPYPERISPLMEQYSALPWDIIVATGDVAECETRCSDAKYAKPCTCSQLDETADASKTGDSRNLHKVLANFSDGSSDLLFAQSDMWLSRVVYGLLRGEGRSTILLPTNKDGYVGNFKAKCIEPGSDEDKAETWDWWRNEETGRGFGPDCAAEITRDDEDAQDEAHAALRELNQCCFGWVDMLYLPKKTQMLFTQMATKVFGASGSSEGSIVTIAHALAKKDLSPPVEHLSCAGDCCNYEHKNVLDELGTDMMCAHPVDPANTTQWSFVMKRDDTRIALQRNHARKGLQRRPSARPGTSERTGAWRTNQRARSGGNPQGAQRSRLRPKA